MRMAFKKITKENRHWEFVDLGHAFIETAIASVEKLSRLDPHRHGGICSLVPVVHNLHQGLENFFKGASLCLGVEPVLCHDLYKLSKQYHDIFSCDKAEHGFFFNDTCIDYVAQFDRRAEDISPGLATRYLYNKKGNPAYSGLTLKEEQLREKAVLCGDECVRVHILLIQKLILPDPLNIVHPLQCWWEPDASFQKRLQEASGDG